MEKRYYAKIYEPIEDTTDYTYLGTIQDIDEPTFTASIMSGNGELVFKLARPVDSFGEFELIDHMRKIEIYVADVDAPSGTRIYSGYIDTYEPTQDRDEYIVIRALGYVVNMGNTLYRSSNDVTLSFTDEPIQDALQAVIDNARINEPNNPINYTATSISTEGNNITDEYNTTNIVEVIDRIVERAGVGWFWYVDADNIIHAGPKPTEATHVFVYGKHVIPPFSISKSVTDLKNRVLMWNSDLLSYLFKTDENIGKYWRRFEVKHDSNYPNSTIMQNIAEAFLESRYQPNQNVRIRILDNNLNSSGYDIESIRVGDTFKIINALDSLTYSINLQITSYTYTPNYIDIIGEDLRSLTSSELKRIEREIKNEQYSDGQPNYTEEDVYVESLSIGVSEIEGDDYIGTTS